MLAALSPEPAALVSALPAEPAVPAAALVPAVALDPAVLPVVPAALVRGVLLPAPPLAAVLAVCPLEAVVPLVGVLATGGCPVAVVSLPAVLVEVLLHAAIASVAQTAKAR